MTKNFENFSDFFLTALWLGMGEKSIWCSKIKGFSEIKGFKNGPKIFFRTPLRPNCDFCYNMRVFTEEGFGHGVRGQIPRRGQG